VKGELKNIKPSYVSYVRKGANKKTFFLMKAEDDNVKPVFEKEVPLIFQKEDPKKLVYGVVYSPNEVDSHGDYATAEEIEKAAHEFLQEARNIDKQHDFIKGAGEVVESYISPVDFTLGEQPIKKGSWVLATKATDEIWEDITKGEITGYSMAGKAVRVLKQEKEEDQVKGFFTVLKNFFAGPNLSDLTSETSLFYKKVKERQVEDLAGWRMTDVLQEALREVIESQGDNKEEQMYKVVDDFSSYLKGNIKVAMDSNILKEDVDLLRVNNKEEDKEMTIQELETVLKTSLEPINNKLTELEKEAGTKEEENISKADIEEVITKSLTPVIQRIEHIEKSRNISRQLNQEEQNIQKQAKLFSNLGI